MRKVKWKTKTKRIKNRKSKNN